MVITLEMYKQIRRMTLDGLSQRAIAKQLHISRNTVRKFMNGAAVPWERKPYERAPNVLTENVKAFIQSCIEQDAAEGTYKQHHTAKRIFERLVEEQQFAGSYSTVRAYVRELRAETGKVFVPLCFSPGEAVQIDWGEARIYLNGEKLTVYLFCARLCYSGAPIVFAYRRQNNESFLDALVRTMDYFGGAPRRIIFDNAKVAVKDGFGANARVQDGYAALAAHYGFEPVFCNPASGNEKGLVEGLVGFSRRNFCVPVPQVRSMYELNQQLLDRCRNYLTHHISGKTADVGTLLRADREALAPLPEHRYDPAKRVESKVNAYSTVRYDTNTYSVPVKYCGRKAALRILPEQIDIYCDGELVASHERCFARQQSIYKLEHYLPLLKRKGRALFQARPVRETVPAYFLDWLSRQSSMKPKELVTLLEESQTIGYDAVIRGDRVLSVPEPPAIQDEIQVNAVDLAAYDTLYAARGRAVI